MGQSMEFLLGKVPMETRWDIAAGGLIFWQVNYHKEVYNTKGREQFITYKKSFAISSRPVQGICRSPRFAPAIMMGQPISRPSFLSFMEHYKN